MKFAIITERKVPQDKRVVMSPEICKKAIEMFPSLDISIEKSDIRCFSDEEYENFGLQTTNDIGDCDVMIGVKEVPYVNLIPDKKYIFFSHTIKKQPYNRKLLQEILNKRITLYDHETFTAQNNVRLIGFGYYAGLVGAYNAIRTWGIKYRLFELPNVKTLKDKVSLINELHRIKLPAIKILLTGTGRVGMGVKEILDALYIKQVNVNDFLNKNFDNTVYCQIDVLDYNKRKDGLIKDMYDFFEHPEQYESNFLRFTNVADLFIAGHFHNKEAPDFFSLEDIKHTDFNIRVIADISCDLHHPIPTTIKSTTIDEPIYGFDRFSCKEGDIYNLENVAVMSVDNLPASLPRDSSEGFGQMFLEHIIPAFLDGDEHGILKRAKITENGRLTERYAYLQTYVDEQE